MFADDHIIVAHSKDPLQISIRKLKTVTYKYGLKISTIKTNRMSFKGADLTRSKIVINNNIMKQINTLNCPVCSISYQNEKNITVKITNFPRQRKLLR